MPSDTDLASLVASRLCHDVVGPVGAIQNGLELIGEDEGMRDMAMDLIAKSAAQASAKLQFARIAYGAAGGSPTLDPGEAGRLVAGLFAGERAALDWQWDGPATEREKVKVAMLLAAFAAAAVPRGGTVTVREAGGGVTVTAEGMNVRTPPFLEVLTEGAEPADPRAVQPLLVARLARDLGWRVEAAAEEGSFRVRAGG
jgi:histidine phosphotransferase ChpT